MTFFSWHGKVPLSKFKMSIIHRIFEWVSQQLAMPFLLTLHHINFVDVVFGSVIFFVASPYKKWI